MTSIHDLIPTMKSLKHILGNIMLITGERIMKFITIALLIYVVLQTVGSPLF